VLRFSPNTEALHMSSSLGQARLALFRG
jgi:hypothetical protein